MTLASIGAVAKLRSYQPRQAVVMQDAPADALYLLDRGRASVSVVGRDGRAVTIGEMGPGEIIGEIALLDGGSRSATVTALTKLELISIDRDAFLRLLEARPRIALALLPVLAARLRRLTRWTDDYAALPVPARLAKCLLALCAEHGQQLGPSRFRIGIKVSQQELAMRIGVTRESANKHLRRFEDRGVITREAGHLVCLDLAGLREAGEGT
jgi:CRP-like cAMP-binding protein